MDGKKRNKSKEKTKDKTKSKSKNKSKAKGKGKAVVELTAEERAAIKALKARVNSDLDDDDWRKLGYAGVDISEFWTEADTVKRIAYDEWSVEKFTKKFLVKNQPCIINGAMDGWKAMRKWTPAKMAKRFGEKTWDVGSYNHTVMSLAAYMRYAENNDDDSPLYVFEPQYGDKFPKLLTEFTIPKYFTRESGNDLMGYMDDDPRPYYRWVLMGPERSGTGIHQDPHNTTAWNALLQGHKRWVMFPPHIKAKAVKPRKGEPDSGIYWFREVYPRLLPNAEKLGMIECVQGPGEMVVVPNDWWHVVLNLDFTISVTQNHVPDAHFEQVFASLARSKPKKGIVWYESLPAEYQPRVTPPSPGDVSSSSSSYSYESSIRPADDDSGGVSDASDDSGSASGSS